MCFLIVVKWLLPQMRSLHALVKNFKFTVLMNSNINCNRLILEKCYRTKYICQHNPKCCIKNTLCPNLPSS